MVHIKRVLQRRQYPERKKEGKYVYIERDP